MRFNSELGPVNTEVLLNALADTDSINAVAHKMLINRDR